MLLKKDDIINLDRIYRLHLINSITGVKPANLIGTRSKTNQDNVAIFSSVVHLGSNPAQIGLVMRPQTFRVTDTYSNIIETGSYTINHVSQGIIKKAHYTSAKLEKENSEFDTMNLKRTFLDNFFAPFVEESPIKIGMKHLETIDLPNGCRFIVGEIELVQLPDEAINEMGQINLEQYQAAGISGLNSYYSLKHQTTLPFVRGTEMPDFNE
jgi:flavin reductase (DIM6/NTAB) family NADH-FMN oxidoreductase RutF